MTQGEDMGMVESSNMKDSSSEKLIRTLLQRKLIIMESSKSDTTTYFCFRKRVRMGDN